MTARFTFAANVDSVSDAVLGVVVSASSGANVTVLKLAVPGTTARFTAKVERVSAAVLGITFKARVEAKDAVVSDVVDGITARFTLGANAAVVREATPGITVALPPTLSTRISSNPTNVGLADDNVNEADALLPATL